jgi:cytochrome oxidase Cu insertion factor (SCO1/SenC/PrrC family)
MTRLWTWRGRRTGPPNPLWSLVLAIAILGTTATSAAAPSALDDLMMDMRITPLDREAPPPLAVTTLDGGRVTLADVRGRVALIYFWATW